MVRIGRVGDSEEEEEESPAVATRPKAGKVVKFQKQPLPPIPRKKTVSSLQITKKQDDMLSSHPEPDTVAAKALQDFKAELDRLTADAGSARNKGSIADFLTDKYLSRRLDTLPTTSIVSRVRREVAGLIEQFIESPRASALASKSSAPAILEGAALSSTYTDLADQIQHSNLHSASAPDVTKSSHLDGLRGMQSPIILSEEDEKQRIKKQYAEYLRLKRDSRGILESADGGDTMSTVAGIRTLLSSLSLRKSQG